MRAKPDVSADSGLEAVIRERLKTKSDRVTDLHLWQVGPGHRAAGRARDFGVLARFGDRHITQQARLEPRALAVGHDQRALGRRRAMKPLILVSDRNLPFARDLPARSEAVQ